MARAAAPSTEVDRWLAVADASAAGRARLFEMSRRTTPPSPSGFARIDDIDSVPVRTEGKDRFRHYLTLPAPKAFFVYASGGWRFWSGADAISRGIDFCEREQRACWLYAVDNEVVWQADEELRVGTRPGATITDKGTLR